MISRLPLEGIRVIDLTSVFAMPYAASMMGDFGADVIKIEGPGRTDNIRGGERAGGGAFPDMVQGDDPWNRLAAFNQLNRSKRSLTLDLSKEEGRGILRQLIKVSDILLENYTPRVMRQWGLDYPNLKKLKPDIIMVSNTGYGHGEGPYSAWPAQATTQEATHGHCWVTGYKDDIPSKAGASFVDFLACSTGLFGIFSALLYRNRTGRGQWIDVGMYQLGAHWLSEYIVDYIANGRLGEPIGNRHLWRSPQGCYPCAGNDQWCVISVGDDEEWAALCAEMKSPELATNPAYIGNANRMERHDEIDAVIRAWTKSLEKFQVMERLQAVGVPSGPVTDARDANLSPHYWARGFLQKVVYPEDRQMGTRVMMGLPWRFSKAPMVIARPPSKFGEDNLHVLRDLLNLNDAEIAKLWETGIISDRPSKPTPPVNLSLEEQVRQGRLAYYDPDYKEKLGI